MSEPRRDSGQEISLRLARRQRPVVDKPPMSRQQEPDADANVPPPHPGRERQKKRGLARCQAPEELTVVDTRIPMRVYSGVPRS